MGEAELDTRNYAALAGWLWDPIGRAVVRRLEPEPGQTALDACCGLGSSALPLADAVGPDGHVDAVDLDTGLIAHLHANGLRPSWLRPHAGDALRFRTEAVDHVVCVHGIAFFPDPTAAGRALVRKLRWGGHATVATWGPGVLTGVGQAAAAARAEVLGESEPKARPALAAGLTDPDGLATWMRRDLDLVDVRVERFRHTLPARPDIAWLLIAGSAFRGLLTGLDDEQRRAVRTRYLARLGPDPIDVTTLIAIGRRDPQ